jgi:hypothetical protein
MAAHSNGIGLIFVRTETAAWQGVVWPRAAAILFLSGRLRFHRPDGTMGDSAGAPSALVAFSQADANQLATCGISGALVLAQGVVTLASSKAPSFFGESQP